jgi:hypothetical protein
LFTSEKLYNAFSEQLVNGNKDLTLVKKNMALIHPYVVVNIVVKGNVAFTTGLAM